MAKAILGIKRGMTQIFDDEGNMVPVTVIESQPSVVVQKKTVETDGYLALQLGFGEVKERRLTPAAPRAFRPGEGNPPALPARGAGG